MRSQPSQLQSCVSTTYSYSHFVTLTQMYTQGVFTFLIGDVVTQSLRLALQGPTGALLLLAGEDWWTLLWGPAW